MRITVIRDDFGVYLSGHISICVEADEADEDKDKIRSFILDFPGNGWDGGKTLYTNLAFNLKSQLKSNVVILHSNKNFDELYNWVRQSKFSKSLNYNEFSTNCADSVYQTLKEAEVVPTHNKTWSFKHLILFLYVPAKVLTPKEVLHMAKCSDNNIGEYEVVLQIALDKLMFHANNTSPEKKSILANIMEKIQTLETLQAKKKYIKEVIKQNHSLKTHQWLSDYSFFNLRADTTSIELLKDLNKAIKLKMIAEKTKTHELEEGLETRIIRESCYQSHF